jgi:hypothetical protein
MYAIDAQRFVRIMMILKMLETAIDHCKTLIKSNAALGEVQIGRGHSNDADARGPVIRDEDFAFLKDDLEQLDLTTSIISLQRVRALYFRTKFAEIASLEPLQMSLDELNRRVIDELKGKFVHYMPANRARYYTGLQMFGPEVPERFSTAIDDIEGAGKCLACGQGTACVLHLMRVMEVGLKALAKPLGIPYAPSWEAYLKHIQTRIDTKYKSKSVKWKRDEPFFRDVSGDLISVKQAWRNPTMHVVRKYSPDEAEEIFRAVRSFMKRLAEGLPKPSSPQASAAGRSS